MRHHGRSSRNPFSHGSCGPWLFVSALLLVALLLPPLLLLPLLLVLPLDPLLSSLRLEWAMAPAPALQLPSRRPTPRGPPRI